MVVLLYQTFVSFEFAGPYSWELKGVYVRFLLAL